MAFSLTEWISTAQIAPNMLSTLKRIGDANLVLKFDSLITTPPEQRMERARELWQQMSENKTTKSSITPD